MQKKKKKFCSLSLTSSSPSSPVINQLQQFGVDGLPGLLQNPDQVSGLAEVPGSEEGVGCAFVGAAGGASNAVDIVLRGVWVIIVDDKLHVLYVCRAVQEGGDRRGGVSKATEEET